MQDLNLKILEPREIECLELAAKFKGLTINGLDDKEGYKAVHEARMTLVRTRTGINKDGKKLRDLTNEFNKNVIKKENELIAIIEPIEKELEAKQDAIDKAKEKMARLELLPGRQEKLRELGATLSDDEICEMTATDFQAFCNEAKHKQLMAEEARIKAENDRIEAERAKLEQEKRDEEIRREAKIKADREAEEERVRLAAKVEADKIEAARLAEQAKADAIKAIADKAEADRLEAERKAAAEKQSIIDEQNRKEAERIRLEKEAAEEKARLEAEELAKTIKAQKDKKYADFLFENGVTNENVDNFFIKQVRQVDGNQKFILYKKLGEVII